jgi:hypothetical protein
MRVTFTKTDAKRYVVAVDREVAPALLPRFGPGNDDLVPHDLAHYLVEEHYGIRLGVFGQLAAGASGLFFTAPEDRTLRLVRRDARIAALGRDDMGRSERLVQVTMAAWEREVGRTWHQGLPVTVQVDPAELAAGVRRVHEVSVQWSSLPFGGELTLEWPARLSVNLAGSRQGRRHRVAAG